MGKSMSMNDYYGITFEVNTKQAEAGTKKITGFFKELEAEAKVTGKTMNEMVKTMDDQRFAQLYNYMETMPGQFKKLNAGIKQSTIDFRFLGRGLQGFRMDLLNVLFLGMTLSSVFNGMRANTSLGGVITSLGKVASELTVGRSHILKVMVMAMEKFVNIMAANPQFAAIIGDVAVALGLLGTAMFVIASIGMAAGSIFGKEGILATMTKIKSMLGTGKGSITARLLTFKKLASAGIGIAIIWDLGKNLMKGGNVSLMSFIELWGLGKVFKAAKVGSKYQAVAYIGLLAMFGKGLSDSKGTSMTTIDAISNAIFAGQLARFALSKIRNLAKYGGMVGKIVAAGIFILETVLFEGGIRDQIKSLWEYITSTMSTFQSNLLDNWIPGGIGTIGVKGSLLNKITTSISQTDTKINNKINNYPDRQYQRGYI